MLAQILMMLLSCPWLQDPLFAFLDLPKQEFIQLRKAIIELVLATDMKQHFAVLGHFNALLQQAKAKSCLDKSKRCAAARLLLFQLLLL